MNGDLAASNVSASTTTMFVGNASIQTLTFTVPGSMGPNCQPHLACPMYALLVTPRAYEVTVENSNGSSTPVTFTVTGAAILP
jgi:hypothetical protein